MFNLFINDFMIAIEAAKKGVKVGKDAVSGLVLVGISVIRGGLQK